MAMEFIKGRARGPSIRDAHLAGAKPRGRTDAFVSNPTPLRGPPKDAAPGPRPSARPSMGTTGPGTLKEI